MPFLMSEDGSVTRKKGARGTELVGFVLFCVVLVCLWMIYLWGQLG